jgi:DNA-binding MarR family transcriptional regulator
MSGMERRAAFDLSAQQLDLDSKLVAATERLATAFDTLLRTAARAQNLSPLQARLLVLIRQRGREAPRAGALAKAFDVTPPTVSDALASLAAKGLVRRAAGAGDAPGVRLRLTPAGRAVARRVIAWADPARAGLGPLPRDEKLRALSALMAWITRLQASGLISVARMCITCRFFRRDVHLGTAAPHHCELLKRPLAEGDLRVDCPEHAAA